MKTAFIENGNKPVKLDLACGDNKVESDHIGIDLSPDGTQADLIVDLEVYPWPFDDDSVDQIYCSHYIEHVTDLCSFMDEVWRILKPGGTAKFVAPYYTSVRAWQDPTHVRAISENTFFYFNREWRRKEKLLHYPIKADFKIEKISHMIEEKFFHLPIEKLEQMTLHQWNVVKDLVVVLIKIKSGDLT